MLNECIKNYIHAKQKVLIQGFWYGCFQDQKLYYKILKFLQNAFNMTFTYFSLGLEQIYSFCKAFTTCWASRISLLLSIEKEGSLALASNKV